MSWTRTTEQIAACWRLGLEADQERSSAAAITVGNSTTLVDALPALLAMRRLQRTRTDLSTPSFLVGGGSGAWYAMAWWGAGPAQGSGFGSDATGARELTDIPVRYAGPDAATVMASLLVAGDLLLADRAALRGRQGKGTLALTAQLEPHAAPGAIVPASALAFALMEPSQPGKDGETPDWSAFASILVAVFVLLLALLI